MGASILGLVGGGVLLILGAEALVRGASRLAAALRVSPLVIGLTIVAIGTSSPEIAVTLKAAAAGQSDMALGNVVGSNIFNVLFILGVAALVAPLTVAQQLLWLDVPIMIGAGALLALLCLDGDVSKAEGALFLLSIAGYTIFLIAKSRQEPNEVMAEYARRYHSAIANAMEAVLHALLCAAGLALLAWGARLFVAAASDLARLLGVSELVIGLTIVAAGTSLPEVAASVMAGLRGERDIAVGNVIGSSIYNILLVLGAAALVAPNGVAVSQPVLTFDLPVMLAAFVACLPIFASGHTIARWEGALFLGYYLAYVAYLLLAAQQHDALPYFNAAMWTFVIPLTVVTLAVVGFRAAKKT